MRTFAVNLLWIFLALAVAAGALFVNVWYFKPVHVNLFFERIFIQFALRNPELLSQLRVLEQFGIDGHMYELTDASPAHERALAALARQNLETLRRYDRAALTPGQQLSYDILQAYLEDQVEGAQWLFHDYPVNPLFGVQNGLPDFMVNVHPVTTPAEAEAYVARLSKFDDKFGQVLEGLRLRESMGVMPPRFVVDKVLEEMRAFIAMAPEQNVLHTSFASRLARMIALPPGPREELLAQSRAAVHDSVYPGYRALIGYFEMLQGKVRENYGVWKLPRGDEYYAYTVRSHTTTRTTPQEVHELGLAEVARIEQQMDAILDAQQYADGTLGERLRLLGEEPRFTYPGTEEGRRMVIADFQRIIDEIDRATGDWFNVRPKSGVRVERVPEFKERTAASANYQGPALDGSRPGVFYINLRDPREVKKYGMRTLAYHEAIPGHHFQVSIQQQLTGVPTFRKVLPFTAYVEGWALYTERLAKEMGFQEDPFDDLGRLRDEMMRAVRLVVDTGLHQQRWTREQAIDYMREKTGLPEADVVAEIERYLIMPGQALAYKVGMLRILELREQARAELGERFDIRQFHDVVLQSGAMPLGILEEVVRRWVEKTKGTR